MTDASSVAAAPRDASSGTTATRDASRLQPARAGTDRGPGAPCAWCGAPIPARSPDTGRSTRADAECCGVVCRKRRHRFNRAVPRVRRVPAIPGTRPGGPAARPTGRLRLAYADPPYPGKAGLYADHPDGGRGEVDHRQLVAELVAGYPDGWALSTSAEALPYVLGLCPAGVRVCVWRRQPRHTRSARPVNAYEPVLVYGGRPLPTDETQTLLDVLDYRGRWDAMPGALVGMKPPEFAVWLFGLLGAQPGDELVDVFPGSGVIGRAWARYASHDAGAADPSRPTSDASSMATANASRSAAA